MAFTGSRHSSEGLARVIQVEAGATRTTCSSRTWTIPLAAMYPQVKSRCQIPGFLPECLVSNICLQVAVIVVSKTARCAHLFRTYGVRASASSCSIVDACLATSAAITFFPSITINGVNYVDGAFKWNNPSSIALSELESTEWLGPLHNALMEVGCFVSVRTGRQTFKREKSTVSRLLPNGALSLKDAATLCKDIALDCHSMHLEVESRFVYRASRAECQIPS